MNSYESVFPYSNISDEDFSLLFGQDDMDFHIDFQMLNNVSSEVLETGKNTYIDDGVDPDDNYFTNNNICKYWLADDFNEYSDALSPSSFGMIHFNSRSMLKNFDSIHEFILHLKFKFPVIGFSETWIHDNTPSVFSMEGFTFYHSDRTKSKGGGVALMISKSFNVTIRQDRSLPANLCESLFIEIHFPLQKNCIIGIVYRDLKSSIPDINTHFNTLLENNQRENKNVYIMGDMNIDFLKCSSVKSVNDFTNIIYNNSFQPVIDKPTRITNSSATLIDNILTNVVSNETHTGIFYNDTTDHLPIYFISSNYTHQNRCHAGESAFPCQISVNEANINSFKKDLSVTDWDEVFHTSDVNSAYDVFSCKYKQLFKNNFKPVKHNNKKYPRKPWITKAILNSISKKTKLYKFSSVQFIWQLKTKQTNHIIIYINIYMKPGPLRSNLCL